MEAAKLAAVFALLLSSVNSAAQVQGKIVDVIPKSFSSETNQESEPSLTINPLHPLQMAISAFTPGISYCSAKLAPIFFTEDGGMTWNLKCWLPSATWTADATLRFSPSGQLYAGILRQPDFWLLVLRGSVPTNSSLQSILVRKPPDSKHIIDQPYLETAQGSTGGIYVGENDLRTNNPDGAPTASMDDSYDAGNTTPAFQFGKVDKRSSWFDLPPIRPAIHKDGTVYAAYIAIHGYDDTLKQLIGDVVVARGHRDSTTHVLSFAELKDAADLIVGNRVVRDLRFPYDPQDVPCCLGQQRYQASLSIAVDPANSKKVYLAWADLTQNTYTLHVRSSEDSGLTWSPADIWTKASATNPALAVDDREVVGFLYQQLTTENGIQKWETALERSGATKSLILAKAPALVPVRAFHPYLGDYLELHAMGNDFYGVFSANNTPDPDYFPTMFPTFSRNYDKNNHVLQGVDGAGVPVSIDPFFFQIEDGGAKSSP